jgi:septal ring factor EnvC (AmiA/AmiB activator)
MALNKVANKQQVQINEQKVKMDRQKAQIDEQQVEIDNHKKYQVHDIARIDQHLSEHSSTLRSTTYNVGSLSKDVSNHSVRMPIRSKRKLPVSINMRKR